MLDIQRVANHIARRCRYGRILACRHIDGVFLEHKRRCEDRRRVCILVVERPDRAVGDVARVRSASRVSRISTEPFGRTGKVGEYRIIEGADVDLGLKGHDQALVRADGRVGRLHGERQ